MLNDVKTWKLQLGQGEMPFEDNMTMEGKTLLKLNTYCVLELVDMSLG